jgi:hypothetical protein
MPNLDLFVIDRSAVYLVRLRLHIFAIDFDLIGFRARNQSSMKYNNDWLEINNDGNRLKYIDQIFTRLFNDVIDASLDLKTSTVNEKPLPKRFLLYFICDTENIRQRMNIVECVSFFSSDVG